MEDHSHGLHRPVRLDRVRPADRDHRRGLRRARDDARPHRAQARTPMGRSGHGRELGDADLRVRVLAAGPDLGLRRRARKAGADAMMVVLLASYIAILALFVWLRFIPFNLFWKLSPVIVLVALNLGLFIPMGWGAPSGP